MIRLLFGLFLLAVSVPTSGQEARYMVSGEVAPVSVASNGFVQQVVADASGVYRVSVAVALTPTGSEARYLGASSNIEVPAGFVVPKSLVRDLEQESNAWSAATTVLRWVAGHIELDNDDMKAQDAASVLRRRRGRCSGLANVTAGLLIASGFEARTRSGLLLTAEGPVPHRWVECRFPDAGWVPTDPTLGFWVVTPRHIAFADSVTSMPELSVLNLGDFSLEALPRRDGQPLRPNIGASLVCRFVGSSEGVVALLRGSDGMVYRAMFEPEAHFARLLPGRWQLEVSRDGRIIARTELLLKAGRRHSFVVEGS